MMLHDCSEITVHQFHAEHQRRLKELVKKHKNTWTRESSDYHGNGDKKPRKVVHGSKVYESPNEAALAHGVSEQCIYSWCKLGLNGWRRI